MPDQPEANPSLRRAEKFFAPALLLILAALNIYAFLHRGGFWRDEVDLLNLGAQNPLKDLHHDPFPVLMSLLIYGWNQLFGGSDAALRWLGLLIGLSLPASLWFAGKSLRQSPPILGLVLFGLNSAVIACDQAMRAYGLGCVLILAYLAAMWSFLQKDSPARFLLLLALAVLSVQTLYQNAVLVAAISLGACAICLRHHRRGAIIKILLVGLLAAVSLQPYAAGLLDVHHTAITAGDYSPRTWRDFLPFADLMSFPLMEYRYVWGAFLIAIIISGLRRLRPNPRPSAPVTSDDALIFGSLTMLAALAGFVWFFSLVERHTQPWHFLPLLAVLAAFLDFAPAPPPRLARTIVFGLVLATTVIGSALAARDLNVRFSNMDAVAATLKADATPRDYILVTPWYFGIGYRHYHQSAAPWDTLPPITDHIGHRYDLVQKFMGDTNALRPVEEKIATTLQNGGRVWIVGQSDLPSPERTRPADLSAPPLKDTGWADTPYNLVWSWQMEYFLTTHATNFVTADIPTNNINPNENLTLVYAQGWRTNTP